MPHFKDDLRKMSSGRVARLGRSSLSTSFNEFQRLFSRQKETEA
ncbi:MAG: hypothetical protein ACYCPP_00565 [Nitrososphaerales archaeon]